MDTFLRYIVKEGQAYVLDKCKNLEMGGTR